MKTQNGLIGFFDILGYQNLLEKNEPEDIADKVIPILENIKSTVPEKMKEFTKLFDENEPIVSPIEKEGLDEIVDSIKWLIFSDTILLSMPVENLEDKNNEIICVLFLATCNILQKSMFKEGLPLRGVINFGKFYIKGTYFAGRPIVEAYQLCNSLELSACVLSNRIGESIKSNIEMSMSSLSEIFFYYYLVPTKTGHKLMYTLAGQGDEGDIKKQVLSSFWGHNKDIDTSARLKAENTEQWLNFVKFKK
jgi:hypothetical protein